MSDAAPSAVPNPDSSESDRQSGADVSTKDIMRELRAAVETQAATFSRLSDSHSKLEEQDPNSEVLATLIEIVSALARQSSNGEDVLHRKISAIDQAVNSSQAAAIGELQVQGKYLAAETGRLSSKVSELFACLHQLEATFSAWRSKNSSEALNDNLDALSARISLIEARTECLPEIKADARRSNVAMSTAKDEIQLLFTQLDSVSRQLNATMTRLEGFRRHFEQLPD